MKKENTILKQVQNDKVEEAGRSMVEMLGVLAVIGVLSVGGVAMYTSAMNKHRANELLNEASKRAASVAAQISMNGKDAADTSVAEFTNPSGYTFGVAKKNANQFNITIDAVDTDICIQMKAAAGTNTPIRKINDTCTELTFNNDMSTTVWASDYETKSECAAAGKLWCESANKCSEGECCATGDCAAGACPAGSSTTGMGGNTGIYVGTEQCACNNSGEYYTKNGCEVPANSCTSWTENQCGKGRYCNFNSPATYTKNGSCNNSNEDYYTSVGPGTCSDITGVDTPNETNMATLTTAGFKNTFVTSGNTQMRWWSAASWCLGQGKHLIDVKEMRCYAQGTRLVEAGDTATYCCKDGQSCQQSSWNTSLWNGTTILEGKETEVAKFSDKIVALRKVYGSDKYFWTASPYGNTSQNSCNAFSVSLYYGGVNFNVGIRYDTNYIYALCE